MRRWLTLSSLTLSFPLHALNCGQVLTESAVLERDLDCRAHPVGLVIGRDQLRLDLNGHTLRLAGDGVAIGLSDRRGVAIVGPGRIEGARTGIEVERGSGLRIEGIEFVAVGEGVRLTNADRAAILDNRFERIAGHAVVALSIPGVWMRAGEHRVEGNTIARAEYGILLDTPYAAPSSIEANAFDQISTFALLGRGSHWIASTNRFGRIGLAPIVD